MTLIFALAFFILGLIIGSFLNVVIFRLNTGKSLGGRSACMACQVPLLWYDLIPVLSFLALLGRCRNCKTKISYQYPAVELLTGILFVSIFYKFTYLILVNPAIFALSYLYYVTVFSVLLVILFYDLKHKIIPDLLSFIFGLLAFAGLFLFKGGSFFAHIPSILDFLAGPILALPFALLWLVSGGRWMGLGDAKLIVGIGWLLGITMGLAALVIAFWSGAIIGLMLIFITKRYNMKTEIPFAPYLIFGAVVLFFFGLPFYI